MQKIIKGQASLAWIVYGNVRVLRLIKTKDVFHFQISLRYLPNMSVCEERFQSVHEKENYKTIGSRGTGYTT